MTDREPTSTVVDISNAAVTLRRLTMTMLRTATEALGWRGPRDQVTHDGASSSYYATSLHQYSGGMATLTIYVTGEQGKPFDVRVSCEIGDVELVNAERIVHESGVKDEEVRDWLARQLDRCLTVLVSRVRGH